MQNLMISIVAVTALTAFDIASAPVQAANKVTLALRSMQSMTSCSLVAWVGDTNGTPNPNQVVRIEDQNHNVLGSATSAANGQANFSFRRPASIATLQAFVTAFGYSTEWVQCSPGQRTN
jgi:hypothetical protein